VIGTVHTLDLKRGPVSFTIDRRQKHDLALWRYRHLLADRFRSFKPDLVHITGPSDIGQLGAYVAHVMRLPLVASWHTELHKFLATRLEKLLAIGPAGLRRGITGFVERRALDALIRFYKIPRAILAPNEEIVEVLQRRTRKPVYLMRRGVDNDLFTPDRRDSNCPAFTLGYVGRLTPEKNVRLLVDVEHALLARGRTDYRFLIVGDGYERPWLECNLRNAEFTGILTGDQLARAYANMDLFLFPSRTDTFGNVVLEALSSGVPVVVTADGGPKFLVNQGLTGAIASDDRQFVERVLSLMGRGTLHEQMRKQARRFACSHSWGAVFDLVYRAYVASLNQPVAAHLSATAYAR
jgi:glycosyltransferase involved in cell wall biosynthesis